VPDAEVIPLGTRGKPGRGSGSANPSSAARTLAGGTKKPADGTKKPADGTKKPADGTKKPADGTKKPAGPTEQPEVSGEPEQTPGDVGGTADEAPRAEAVRESAPVPPNGIPVGDWLAAFTAAAKEVFGETWEPRLAELLAFLRRRVTGD
jgi:hypothetical protein